MLTTIFNGALKYAVAIMAALLLGLAGYNFYLRNVTAKLNKAIAGHVIVIDNQGRELKAGAARELRFAETLKKHQADNAALVKRHKESNDKLEQTLRTHEVWANKPLPAGVTEWLRHN